MTKKRFLDTIQNRARLSEKVAKIWALAVKLDESDERWAKVENHPDENIVIQQFESVFGLAEAKPTEEVDEDERRRKYYERQLEKAEKKLAEMKERGADPDRIKLQEKKIENFKFMIG